jgi:hypothetical protein
MPAMTLLVMTTVSTVGALGRIRLGGAARQHETAHRGNGTRDNTSNEAAARNQPSLIRVPIHVKTSLVLQGSSPLQTLAYTPRLHGSNQRCASACSFQV